MKVLKKESDWIDWQARFMPSNNAQPQHYPCFVYSRVTDWINEKTDAVFLYEKCLHEMIDQLDCPYCDGEGYVYAGGMSMNPEVDNKIRCNECNAGEAV